VSDRARTNDTGLGRQIGGVHLKFPGQLATMRSAGGRPEHCDTVERGSVHTGFFNLINEGVAYRNGGRPTWDDLISQRLEACMPVRPAQS
jgi:hypothetical protein